MFNNVTKTCSGTDVTWEILTMLAGAFLLGCLLCWLIRKLRGLDTTPPSGGNRELDNHLEVDDTDKSSLHSPVTKEPAYKNTHQANQTYKARKVGVADQSTYSTPRIDDLKKISGIDENTELLLKDMGIKSYIDLRDIDHKTLLKIMDSPNFNIPKQEVETWPHQSSLAAKAEWKKLTDYQDFRSRSLNTIQTPQAKNAASNDNDGGQQTDDLTKIIGITPEIENILNENKISTYAQLKGSSREDLRQHLTNNNINLDKLNIGSWHQQAEFAKKGRWEELEEYQDFLDINNNLSDNNKTSLASTSSSVSKINKKDDLKKIKGINSKIEEVLNNNGIDTFEKLFESDRNTLKSHLDNAGSQFRIYEPDSWSHQAGMAYRGEWNKLKEYQDFLAGGGSNAISLSSTSKSTEVPDTNEKRMGLNDQDDLTKIEGIGPKIQEVLNNHDVKTFEQLHKSNRNTLKLYLDESGPQFRMHEPESWPHQAGMAARGEWDKLAEYQDFMIIGSGSVNLGDTSGNSPETDKKPDKRAASLSTNYVDDLTKIEGIGPKIEKLLNDAGILNFSQLSSVDRDTIKTILDNGGPQFKMHEPKSWPKQAKFANNAEWKKLEEYQDEILGGK